MKKFEYKTIEGEEFNDLKGQRGFNLLQLLNEYGEHGWEFIIADFKTIYFKREKKEDEE